jgi:septal ring-binding cell division protein DamX
MKSLKTFTHIDLLTLHPCEEGLTWANTQATMSDVWTNCPRGDWLWWLLREIQLPTKEQSVLFANNCATSTKQYTDATAADDYAAAAADTDAADTDAAADAAAAAAAATYAAAADATTYAAAERLNQANFIRSIIPNPFI